MNIPFHKPWYDDADEKALLGAMKSGTLVGDGPATRDACTTLRALLGVKHVLLTPSCTHALELAMMVLYLKPGDEVIVPSFTFVSTTNCVLRQGATVVFADIDPLSLTLSPESMQSRLTPRTRAVIPVGYAGVSPAMDEITTIARAHAIAIVEDAAQSIGALYKGRPQGTNGDIGCLSFHETKNISTGEGGAFFTDDDDLAARAEICREKGTNRKQFLQGLVDKYTWVDVGSSYLPPDHTGALLVAQLAKLGEVTLRRKTIHDRYMEGLQELATEGRLALPQIPPHSQSNHHIFYLLLENNDVRNRAIEFFRSKGIGTTFHYLPLHLSRMGVEMGYKPGDMPVTESMSARLLRLPIYPTLTPDEQHRIIQTMYEFLK